MNVSKCFNKHYDIVGNMVGLKQAKLGQLKGGKKSRRHTMRVGSGQKAFYPEADGVLGLLNNESKDY
jgi:hypothetical protein